MTARVERTFDASGVAIRFVEQGAGEPVVLVHCYTGNLDDQWIATGVLDGLAVDHRAIAFDLRGHGRSGKPHDAGAYGAAMGSTYLRRPLPPEVLVEAGRWRVVRRRQTLDDMLRLEDVDLPD